MAVTRQQVAELYVATFNRAPDAAGLDYWVNTSGLTIEQIAKSFFDQAETKALYPAGNTDTAFVTSIYTNLFNRAPDAEGLSYWVAKLTANGTTPAEMTRDVMIEAMKNGATGTDATIIANKATVGLAYAASGLNGTTFSLTSVTADATTVNAALTSVSNLSNPGSTFALTTGTTDVVITTAGNDTITATTATDDAGDMIVDASTTDNDTLNWTATAATAALKVTNVENVNVTIASTAAAAVDAQNFSGVDNLTVTRTDVTVGGSTITGNKAVSVTHVNGSTVEKITTGAGTTDVAVSQADTTLTSSKAGVIVDAATATGDVSVTGAATVTAGSTASKSVTVVALNDATLTTENAKAVSITANTAGTILVDDSAGGEKITGAITIAAAKATSTTIDNATGGATVTAGTTSTADTTIAINNIDASGATITTGTGSSVAAEKQITINLDGTSASDDVATITAAGYISLDANTSDLVDIVNLSGNGAAVTYTMVTSAPTTYNLTGAESVTVSNSAANFAAATGGVNDTTTAGTTTAKLTTVTTTDLSKVLTDKIEVAAAGTSAVLTLKTGASLILSSDQTTAFSVAGKATGATISIATADDTSADGTTIDLTVGTFTADTNVQTLNIDATVGKFTATSTVLDVAGSDATTLNITGTKAVTLGTTSAKTVVASNLTAALSATFNNATAATSVTSGSGNDVLGFNDTNSSTTVYTVDAGNGNNQLTITNAKEASYFVTGTGTDTINVDAAAAYVISAGEGNDTVKIGANVDSDAILVGGAGNDTLTFLDTNGNDFSDNNTNFAFTGFETVNIAALTSGAITISNAQFNAQTLTVVGTASGSDKLVIKDVASGASTIDASNVTLTDALLEIQGGAGADIITGSAYNDIIDGGVGSDTINGGDGTDTYVAVTTLDGFKVLEGTGTGIQTGMVINLGSTAITNTTILSAISSAYTADSVTSVAAGSAVYLYGSSASTNAATVDTLSSIENVTGSAGADYIVGSVGANTIAGGAGADIIIGGLGADTLTGDAGADTFVFSAGSAGTPSSTVFDTITDYTSGTDIIDFGSTNIVKFATAVASASGTAGITVTTGVVAFDAADSTDALRLVAVAHALGTAAAGNAVVYLDATSSFSYLFITDGVDGVSSNDVLIKLTGVTADELTVSSGSITAIA